MMARRSFLSLAAAVGGALGLSSCGRSVRSRFKLTLGLNTPQGVRSGSSVIETRSWEVQFPMSGVAYRLTGEAAYVDLGPGRRPLIALLTSSKPFFGSGRFDPEYWSGDGGPMTDFFLKVYGETPIPQENFLDKKERLSRYRGARDIPPAALPDLVTFADVNRPASVMKVDPDNLTATLGPEISWNRITLEMTDERVTTGIEKKLPWLNTLGDTMLDGVAMHYARGPQATFANSLNRGNFIH